MSDSKLPQVRSQTIPTAQSNKIEGSLAELRKSRLLFLSGLVAAGSAIGVFFLFHYIFASVVLVILGLGFLGASQLVKKSLALTAPKSLLLAESPLQQLEEIRKQVSKCKFLEKVEKEGTLLSDQSVQLIQQYKNLQSVLDKKFEPTELTYARYSESIFNSCLAIAENMLHAKNILENLNVTSSNSSSDAGSLWNQQKAEAVSILDSNAMALTELATLFSAINQIITKEKYRDQLEESMLQIRDLAERTKQYSKH